jgi:hypothetical protein
MMEIASFHIQIFLCVGKVSGHMSVQAVESHLSDLRTSTDISSDVKLSKQLKIPRQALCMTILKMLTRVKMAFYIV